MKEIAIVFQENLPRSEADKLLTNCIGWAHFRNVTQQIKQQIDQIDFEKQ